MRVSFNGRTHKVAVRPGPDGAREFENRIRSMLALPEDQEFDVRLRSCCCCFCALFERSATMATICTMHRPLRCRLAEAH
jgi:hypothetical protein